MMKWLEFLMKDMPSQPEPTPAPTPAPDAGTTPEPTPAPANTTGEQNNPNNTGTSSTSGLMQTQFNQLNSPPADLEKLQKMVEDLQKQNAALAARVSATNSTTGDNYEEAILALTGWKGVLDNANTKN